MPPIRRFGRMQKGDTVDEQLAQAKNSPIQAPLGATSELQPSTAQMSFLEFWAQGLNPALTLLFVVGLRLS